MFLQARHVAMVIGQAFSVAYKQFLRATGISEAALEQAEYAHVLNAQSAPQAELDQLRDRNKTRKVRLRSVYFQCLSDVLLRIILCPVIPNGRKESAFVAQTEALNIYSLYHLSSSHASHVHV